MGSELRLRVLQSILAHGQTEILIPNRSKRGLPYSMAKAVHDSRSGIEFHVDVLNNPWAVSNFARMVPPVISQEQQATVPLGQSLFFGRSGSRGLGMLSQPSVPRLARTNRINSIPG